MAGPAIPLIAAAIPAISNFFSSRANAKRTNKANRQLAEYSYSKDLEQWERQNQYNKPIEQMRRLREGGLNPNLIYGSSGVVGNTTSQHPKYNAPKIDYNQITSPISADFVNVYQDFELKQAQIDLTRENQFYTGARASGQFLKNAPEQIKQFGTDFGHNANQKYQNTIIRKWQADVDKAGAESKLAQLKTGFQQQVNQIQKAGLASGDSPELKAAVLMMLQSGVSMKVIRGLVVAAGISSKIFDKMVNVYKIKR